MKLEIGKRLWWLSLLLIFAIHSTFAQNSGKITGTVTDPTGAIVPSATVTALNTETNVATTIKTNGSGLYVLAVSPGNYSLRTEMTGFEPVTLKVTVDALATVSLDIKLSQISGQTTNVVVSEAALNIQTADATLETTVQNKVYAALPLEMSLGNPRDPTAFIALAPGVASVVHQSAGPDYTSFNGARAEVNGLYLEGLPITFSNQQGDTRPIYMAVSVDAVNQFQVVVNGEGAQFQGQGFHNYTIKNGTDKFHGTLFEFLRNTAFDARNYFFQFTPKDNQNEYGGNIGGPIIKGKLFFFANYDGYSYNTASAPNVLTIPTAAELSGDFSALPTPIYDPTTETCSGSICTKQQFQYNGKLNVIPPNRISQIAESFASHLPSPNLPSPSQPGFVNNYVQPLARNLWQRNISARIDYHISPAQTLYGVFAYGEWHTDYTGNLTPTGTALPLPYTASPGIVEEFPLILQVHHTYTFSSSLVNSFGIGVIRLAIPIFQTTQSGNWATTAGLTGLPGNGQAAKGFPATSFSGPNAPANWGGTPFQEWENDYVAQDTIEWVHGNHVFTFGGQLTKTQDNRAGASPTDGTAASFSFSNASTAGFSPTGTLLTGNTGNAIADFVLGDVDGGTVTNNKVLETGPRFTNYSLFTQDDWKVTPKLTVNLGFRWDVYRPFAEEHNLSSYLNPTLPNPSASSFPGALAYGAVPIEEHYKNFEPRIGLAYSLKNKTVIRASFSMADTLGAAGIGGNSGSGPGQNGFNPPTSINSTVTGQPAFNWNSGVPTPVSPSPLLSSGFGAGNSTTNPSGAISPPLLIANNSGRSPEYINWSAGFQRQIPHSTLVGATYSGSEGHFVPGANALGGTYTDSMPLKYLALGSLLQASATPANVAAAQAQFPNISVPFPGFQGTIATMLTPFPQYKGVSCYSCDYGNSIYHSLQFMVNRRSSTGLQMQVAYTLAWENDDILNGGQLGSVGGTRNPFNPKLDYGPGSTDYRDTLHVFGTYPLPFGKGFIGGKNLILRALLSDWTLSGIFTYQTGAPLAVTGSGCVTPGIVSTCMVSINPGFSGSIYTQQIGTGNVLTTSYLNKSAFMDPAPFTFGNEPRSAPFGLRAPTTWEIDGTVDRSVPIREWLHFDIGADFFNLPNHPIFSAPATNIDSSSFGHVSSTQNSARSVQVHARLTF